ncbi:hypothetical protein JCM3765_005326 [Sporobolomyces pararoseus]
MSSSMMKRTASMCSLPSPPADSTMDLAEDSGMEEEEEEDDEVTNLRTYPQNPSRLLPRQSKRAHMMMERDGEVEEEVDELETEDEEPSSDEPLHKKRNTSRRVPALALGSPVNVSTSTSSRASRKQLLNPFFLSADSRSSVSRPSALPSSSPEHHSSSSNLTSPTRHSRRRVDPDRIKLNQQPNITPPQKSRLQLQEERLRQEAEEAQANKRREMMGWNDPDNPFLDKNDEMFKRNQSKGEPKRPETLTYVKRGERIQTSIPFTAVLTSSSPSEDPFTYTTPRLLFPPAPPKIPTTPPSSFLQALRASSSSTSTAAQQQEGAALPAVNKPHGEERTTELPPTPVTMKRKKPARSYVGSNGQESSSSSSSGSGYKRMRLPNSEAQHQHLQQRTGLRQ